MILKISRHVFGSHHGYRTLAASSDLTSDEIAELESFAFGQTNDSEFVTSLIDTPAYWARPLSSGRRAVTRALPGPADEQGRQSLRFVTVVLFVDDWLSSVNGEDVPLLRLDKIWQWNGHQRLPREEVQVSKPPRVHPTAVQRSRILSLVAMIESLSDSATTTIIVEPHDVTAEEFAMVLALLPHWYRPQFSYGVRSLSEGLPVLLNHLAPGASRGKSRRRIVRWAPTGGLLGTKYASGLAHFWKPGESPPWGFVHNCRAFGQLVPTWEGIESLAGAVAPTKPQPIRIERKGRRFRIPASVYWVFVVAVAVAATSFVVTRTIQSRRLADAVLAAAEEFLDQNADSAKLPESGHSRAELIRRAESHMESVAAMRDSSRAERRSAVEVRLREWLTRATGRAEDYASLDETLFNFDRYLEHLSLDKPGDVARIPARDIRVAVQGWKTKLEEAMSEATQIGGTYPDQINAGLDRIAQWESRVRNLLLRCQSGLATVANSLREEPPIRLTNEILKSWEQDRAELTTLKAILPDREADNDGADNATDVDEELASLWHVLEYAQQRADTWGASIEKLRGDHSRFLDRATQLVAKHGLEIEPVRAEDLAPAWKSAQDARAALDQALRKWPDSPDAIAQDELISEWMKKASDLANEHFADALGYAESVWKTEKERAALQSSLSGHTELPNPDAARSALRITMAYWDGHADAIRFYDRQTADALFLQATSLHSELSVAQDKYDAHMKKQSQPPTSGPSSP